MDLELFVVSPTMMRFRAATKGWRWAFLEPVIRESGAFVPFPENRAAKTS